jgi:hypothetical protein
MNDVHMIEVHGIAKRTFFGKNLFRGGMTIGTRIGQRRRVLVCVNNDLPGCKKDKQHPCTDDNIFIYFQSARHGISYY